MSLPGDFRIRDLMQPGSLFPLYRHSPSDRDRVRPLVRLLITIIVRRLTEEMDYAASGAERQRLLVMLDEFANLGRLEVMEESLAYLAGYGIRVYLVLQDIQQLYKTYSRDETILSHVISAPRSRRTNWKPRNGCRSRPARVRW